MMRNFAKFDAKSRVCFGLAAIPVAGLPPEWALEALILGLLKE
jgi:hypothetical protein